MRRSAIAAACASALAAPACVQADLTPPPPALTPAPRKAAETPFPVPFIRPTPTPTPVPTPEPGLLAGAAQLGGEGPRPAPTPSPAPPAGTGPDGAPLPRASAPTAFVALEATFRRDGRAAVRQPVTAGVGAEAPQPVGTTEGGGFVRLVLPERALPVTWQLVVGGLAAGSLFLAAGKPPRANPTTGWTIELGRDVVPLR